jgi:hypothetical protein
LSSVRARRWFRPRLLAGLAAGLAVATGAILFAVGRGGQGSGSADPLVFEGGRSADYARAAAFGLSHVLYVKSPGGVLATAARTARFRRLIEAAVAGSGVSADMLEALVFLESAGRPEVIAGNDPAQAAGLTQILAETAANFLGMRVELAASRRLTGQIAAASERGAAARVARLRVQRRRLDQRFDPARALAGTVRYLSVARERFGRADLAFVSYHMGIGNLETVLRAYVGSGSGVPIRDLVRERDLSWARVYFDASPRRHAVAWQLLDRLGDDSRTYYWRLLAAREIMRLFRSDRDRLEQLARLQAGRPSAADVLHPPAQTQRFLSSAQVERGLQQGLLQRLPDAPGRWHFRIAAEIRAQATRLGRPLAVSASLRPQALALLVYLTARVRLISGEQAPLTVARTLGDASGLPLANKGASRGDDWLHASGYAFDLRRRYASPAQAGALQFELERLQALGLIAWARTPAAIHVTVAAQLPKSLLRWRG